MHSLSIAAMHHPQKVRFAIAVTPSTMINMKAIGVSHRRILGSP